MMHKVDVQDPVGGVWKVASVDEAVVWCDASSLALGAAIEFNGVTVEDATWLRKKNDALHINVAELDAVVKGINMALRWESKQINNDGFGNGVFVAASDAHR